MTKLTDLRNGLIEKYSLSDKEAEAFIASFVDVLTEGLKEDKQVKIKALGTFKLVSVSARESVDVNTGERIVIDGRDKISFTPENALRDRINAPFDLFETVVVHDDTDFSVVDEKYQGETVDLLSDTIHAKGIKHDASKEGVVEKMAMDMSDVEPAKTAENNQVVNELQVTNDEATGLQEIEKPVDVQENVEDKQENTCEEFDKLLENQVEKIEDMSENNVNKVVSKEIKSTETVDETKETAYLLQIEQLVCEREKLTIENQNLYEQLQHNCKKQRWLARLIGVLSLILIGGLAYFAYQFAPQGNLLKGLPTQFLALNKLYDDAPIIDSTAVVQHITMQEDSVLLAQNNRKNTNEQVLSKEHHANNVETVEEKPVEKIENKNDTNIQTSVNALPKSVNSQMNANQDKYNADARIRTGAYIITGVAQTVTVKSGQTLASISKAHLGGGMECYVEALNPHANNLKVGDKVKIPSLQLKKKKQ